MNIKPASMSFAVIIGALLISACGSSGSGDSGASESASDEAPETALIAAVDECGVDSDPSFDLGDEGYTLSIDGKGDEDSLGADLTDIACVLNALDVSDAVIGRIDNTRALDGTLEGDWDGFTATWSYHPDSGLSMVIEEE